MNSPEGRRYVISGEIPLEDWSLALQVLGKLGIDAIVVDLTTQKDEELHAPQGILLEPGTIPYALAEIKSREQYVCNEHLGEFWPEFRAQVRESGKTPNKYETLCWGLNMLTHPRPKGRKYIRETPPETAAAEFTEKLGLVTVKPRSLVGFSDKYAPRAYGLWDHEEYGDTVIEVGSFINAARLLAELPVAERPYGISVMEIKFFNALADKLEAQIAATTYTE